MTLENFIKLALPATGIIIIGLFVDMALKVNSVSFWILVALISILLSIPILGCSFELFRSFKEKSS